ncbi:MAG: AraC family transcriptional regulator [Bacteroides sp.]|nr:AraC family transcriptional regulator [Bacteroides sp.]
METNLHDYIVFSNDPGQINSPAFYDCVVHLLCRCGSAVLCYNGQSFEISKDRIAILSQPRLVRVEQMSKDFKCEYIAAPDKFLHNLLPANNYSIQGCVSLFSNPIIEVSADNAEKFRMDMESIRCRIDDIDHRFYSEMIGSLLQTMIYDLFDFHTRHNDNILTTDRVGYLTTQFFAMIEAGRPKTQREVAYYAHELNVTSKYLSDTIKRVTGHSISSHINKVASSIIIEYLKDNRLSITQIADEMNFASVSYFSRYCTKHIGMSPTQYRLAGAKNINANP